MFSKILIANRGEIACRVIRACRELNVKAVAIYSEVDREAPHVKLADEAYCVGEANPLKSYLNIPGIIEVLTKAGAEAVHPGYGFLSENYRFAEAVEKAGAVWIGPDPATMRRLASKTFARRTLTEAGIPVAPGSLRPLTSADEARRLLSELGPPLILKPDYGGGGKGTRKLEREEEADAAFEGASREAHAYFGQGEVYAEKLLTRPRHVEVQVLADKQGNAVHLFERECSIQRRYQKIVEEAPAPCVDGGLRGRLTGLALKVVETLGYTNAGTVEFLVEPSGNPYFLEVNKRVQVEHPVTEMVTGVDIVKQQILVASGAELQLRQSEIGLHGCAVEGRVYAEDPLRFYPSPGKIIELQIPSNPNLRVDHALEVGLSVPYHYDPLIAKAIAWGRSRLDALDSLRRALSEFKVGGIKTNIPLLLALLDDERFVKGEIYTTFLDESMPQISEKVKRLV